MIAVHHKSAFPYQLDGQVGGNSGIGIVDFDDEDDEDYSVSASPLIGASEHLLRTTAEMFYITDETLIQELLVISQKMQEQQAQQGQAGKPGVNVPGQGAQAGGQ